MPWWKEKKYYRIILWSILTIIGLYFIYLVRGVFLSFILAITLAYLLNPVITSLEYRGTPRVLSILITYAVLVIIITSVILYGMPHMQAQLNHLAEVIPEYAAQVKDFSLFVQEEYARAGIPATVRDVIEERIEWLQNSLVGFAKTITKSIVGAASYLFNILLAPVLAFYILKDKELFRERIVHVMPARWRDDMFELGAEINKVVNNFIHGYAMVSLLVGSLVWISMGILGVEFPLMLGIFAGITNIIPYFGPIIGLLPAAALALLSSKWLTIKVIIAFTIIQQLEGNFISPKILGDRVGLHPLFVILILLAGGQLFGLIGIILAVPVSAILRVIIKFILKKLLLLY
ncbi:MAG: AI-2E family transporter [Clostridiales bacterium]|nr:AI-2E family transporter [Clostridiales bacterium]MCF8021117.1 AI-2E family transporter [Clostridiales bacterium]